MFVSALVPGSSPKSRAESRQFAREKAGSKGKEHHQVIACKLNLQVEAAVNKAVSCAWCSCCSLCIASDMGEGMRTDSVFEIQTSKLISKWTGLYLLHSWRQVREGKGEQGDKGSHPQTL